MPSMKQQHWQITFLTPAFLGNASQNAQWRTPPFKALLRQWWRVAWAADNPSKDVASMHRQEGELFGNAWLTHEDGRGKKVNDYCKSLVRLRLYDSKDAPHTWQEGTQKGVAPMSTGLDTSYAWFGLIKRSGKNRESLPDRSAIKAGASESSKTLSIAAPEKDWFSIERAVALAHAFGTLGSRSRGGWGSLHIAGAPLLSVSEIKRYARPLDECLVNDWGSSLALHNGRLCIWESKANFKEWSAAMAAIAVERRHVRTTLGKDLRIALGFAQPGRMPSPLRWKLVRTSGGSLLIRVFAMPHRIPEGSGQMLSPEQLKSAWGTVLKTLNESKSFKQVEE